jgi:nucleoside-diphosphate kinase
MQNTLSIIKPDATKRNITGSINKIIEDSGLRIIAQKRIKLSQEMAKKFYHVHKEKSFFNELVEYMTSESVVVQVLQGENAVSKYRDIMGATNPNESADGTIRKLHALNIQENSVHGSDSVENASHEISFFFEDKEIVG